MNLSQLHVEGFFDFYLHVGISGNGDERTACSGCVARQAIGARRLVKQAEQRPAKRRSDLMYVSAPFLMTANRSVILAIAERSARPPDDGSIQLRRHRLPPY